MNKIIISGNLTRDPKLYSGKKTDVANFTVAVDSYEKGETKTTFFPCVAFDKVADAIANYCVKGSKVCVIGTLRRTSYEDSKTKEKKEDIEIAVAECEFLGSKNNK